jgi:hypothetical protein
VTSRRFAKTHQFALLAPGGVDVAALLRLAADAAGTIRLADGAVVMTRATGELGGFGTDACLVFCREEGRENVTPVVTAGPSPTLIYEVTVTREGRLVARKLAASRDETQTFAAYELLRIVESIVSDREYVGHYRRNTLLAARDLLAALRLHSKIGRFANASRKEVLGRQLSRPASYASSNPAADVIRTQIGDEVTRLARATADSLRRCLLSDCGLQANLLNEIDKLRPTDLARERGRKAIRLSLAQEVQTDLAAAVREQVEREMQGLYERLEATFAQLRSRLARLLRLDSGAGLAPAAPRDASTTTLLERLAELTQISIKYRGLLPRRGFIQRLAEGRKSIFTFLMLCSLFGSFIGFNWRSIPVLGWLFLCGFVVAVIHTYRAWLEEDEERLAEELEKAKELLRAEIKRVLGETIREVQTFCSDSIEQHKRTLLSWVEEVLRSASAQAQQKAQAARESAQLSLKQIDTREQRALEFGNRLGRLETELGQLIGPGP